MSQTNVIDSFQKTIIDIYRENSLNSLKGLSGDFKINDKQILVWYFEVTSRFPCEGSASESFMKIFEDLIWISEEILYFTANVFLYRPYINDPLKDEIILPNGSIFPDYQNNEAKRFYMFADVVFEKLYNFWDRIGDLIEMCFPGLLKKYEVNFSKVIDIVPEDFRTIDEYTWLYGFKESSYNELNSRRREIVHYKSTYTKDKYHHISISSDRIEVEKWIDRRNHLADLFKQHNQLCIDGFYNAVKFIEVVSEWEKKDQD